VTSLFYLVPAVTAAMDHAVLGNRLSPASLAGMAAILLGVALVFRTGAPGQAPAPAIGPRRGS
jgi:drug/metabolite transporter (DMT)-like permease